MADNSEHAFRSHSPAETPMKHVGSEPPAPEPAADLVRLSNKIKLTPTGAEFPPDLNYGEWLGAMDGLFKVDTLTPWAIGYGLSFGEQRYGERYAQVLALASVVGKNVDTLRKYQWVAERVPSVRRRTSLSWTHHDAVAALDPAEQERFLALAEANEMNASSFRKLVSEYKKAEKNPDAEPPEPKERTVVKMTGPAQKEPPTLVEPQPTDEEAHAAAGEMTDEEAEKLYGKREDVMPDPIDELWGINGMLVDQLESLTVDDKAKEIRKLHERIVAIEGRLRGETTAKNEAIKQARYQGALLRKVRDLLGVERNQDIVSRLLALIQR